MFILLVWVTCAIVCGIMAGKKDREVALWAILGLIFGVFAVIILAVLDKKEDDDLKRLRQQVESAEKLTQKDREIRELEERLARAKREM